MKSNVEDFWGLAYKVRYQSKIKASETAVECGFLAKFLDKQFLVLDFGCGSGRHTLGLARKGYRVHGFDRDGVSIAVAKHRAALHHLRNGMFRRKNLLSFHKKGQYHSGICMYSSIGFLQERENKKLFRNFFDAIHPGGRIILDLMNPLWAKKNVKRRQIKKIAYDGVTYTIIHEREICNNPLREINCITFHPRISNTTSFKYSLRLYGISELRQLLKTFNFKVHKIFGSFREDKPSSSFQRLIIVADKLA